jgi:hypothetical protein
MMNTVKKLTILAIAVVFLALATHSFGYQVENKISLMATPQHPGASGTVVVTDTSIEIEASGLKSDSVYTAWFVNTKPKKHETGAGQAPYMFKTDSYGNGTYSAGLSESPFGHQAGEEKHADIHNHQQVIQPAEIAPKNDMVAFKSFVQFFITNSQHMSSPFV